MNSTSNPFQLVSCLALAFGLSSTLPAAPTPYNVDANTLHLYHFEEVQNTNSTLPALPLAAESVSPFLSPIYDLEVTNGAKFVASTLSASLTNVLDARGDIPGLAAYQAGAFAMDNIVFYPDDIASASGAFTLEALVSPDFDPAAPDAARPNMQIVSLDNEGDIADRVFHFRLASNATNEQWSLEFENIGSAAAGSNAPATVTLIDDFSGDLSAYDDIVILDNGGVTTNAYRWEIVGGMLQITTTNYDDIEQYALTRNDHPLPIGQMLVCAYDHSELDSQDIGLYIGAATPSHLVRQDYVTVYVRNDGNIYTRGFNGGTEFGLVGGGIVGANVDYLFIERTTPSNFVTGYYSAGVRTELVTRTVANTAIGNTVGFYADVRGLGTRGTVDNLALATNYVAVPPADPEVFSALLPTNGANAAVQGDWYHVAVTYTGAENTANNLKFYWTALGGSPAMASELASFRMTNDLGSAAGGATIQADFAVGNEGRDTPGENFNGFIDEVRVSDVARAAGGFNLNGTPYTGLEANSKLLYHFDETTPAGFPTSLLNNAMDELTANTLDCNVRDGATFGVASFAGFGNAMLVSPTTATNNFPLYNLAGAFATIEDLPFDPWFGSSSTGFTIEALIRPDFDPASTNREMHIVTGEGDGGVETRGWQLRFDPRATPNDLTNALRLRFVKIANGVQEVTADVPTTGPHAVLQGSWYHVAVTFNGQTNDPSNLKFYWTALNSEETAANLIGVDALTSGIAGTEIDFSIGNEGRSTGGNSLAFVGAMDEVRISKVARAADEFLLTEQIVQPEIVDGSADFGAGTVTLTWSSLASETYAIQRADTVSGTYVDVKTGIAGAAGTTTDTASVGLFGQGYYRIRVE